MLYSVRSLLCIACVKYVNCIIIKYIFLYLLALCNERHLVRNVTKVYISELSILYITRSSLSIACVKYFSGIIRKYFLALCNERHLVRNATKKYICNLFYFSSIQFYSTLMGIIMQLCENSLQHSFYVLPLLKLPTFNKLGRLGCDRMVVAFTTTCAISAYHH